MGAVTPEETLGTLYNIRVGSNKTKQHSQTDPMQCYYPSSSFLPCPTASQRG